ncbi:hypothetical protein [Halorussus sp. MSC15.2]|uniref:hypothetical protein n=1 Tax=Halorussus sp. MSC15.2 TaxID=2283638 RepID=UPI0013D190EF|nr:hypothetical protein [Halorussus sp. MSC15.2]NEU58786.1 hypothetical protein [Halorussus sp. MSC15.2]
MQGFGISTLLYNYNASPHAPTFFENFRTAELVSEMPLETFYGLSSPFHVFPDTNIRDVLDDELSFLRENFLKRENHKTRDGRPVVTFWAADYPAAGGWPRVKAEWGGFEAFMDYLRAKLSVDGVEPYVVGEFRDHAVGGYPRRFARWNRLFDAAMTWVGSPDPGTTSWQNHRKYVERNYQETRQFALQNDMEFIPTVFPGFDDRQSWMECRPRGRYVPRNPSHLADLLRLADEYRVGDRIYLASFNDWTEAHMIEPGRYHGRDYGTAYLEVIRGFLRNKQLEEYLDCSRGQQACIER